ncbi:MAG: S-adenosylmethionine:tRNA ribosyltransferase-isomerase, partial [Bdellovibrionales bacterium]|nr:S-adenosylmethionine:tRNA ribosyltransferase-isomerase [Bdellovibrionales bacterium]NQZ20393.1 S-adenosylmethionine:tRNA ribosyltransferase-isomerase [Bdellovibrionales bacterium]
PLPPYIQEARGERASRPSDDEQYQTDWAEQMGSLAAPTASLHFSNQDIEKVKARGADVKKLCLHVGLGTFLPVYADDLNDHVMHSEFVSIPAETWEAVLNCQKRGGKVWALGSTVVRSLESQALKMFESNPKGWSGETDLFIKPGFEYKAVDVMMTNFHQPESTLIAMVMAFSDQETVNKCYEWAIERQFRLFSYGDLSVWKK